jgi:hypothetical protein
MAACREKIRSAGEYLLLEDTSAFSFTQRDPLAGMGPLTNSGAQGFLVHSNLAVRIAHWDENVPSINLVGLLGQQCWARQTPQGTRAERKKKQRRQKRSGQYTCESERWAKVMAQTGQPPQGARWTLVADRECDIFDVMARCSQLDQDWVLRASQARRTTSPFGNVFQTVSQAPPLGRFSHALRSRPGVPARTAQLELRAVAAEIMPPRELPGEHECQATNILEVREINPPDGVSPLHWVLLTSWNCENFGQARRAVSAYSCRWLIEEYHKALKTGTHIEDSQLSTGERIQNLLAIHAVVAVDLLQLKLSAKNHPDEPIEPKLLEPEALAILELQFGRPKSGWTNGTAICAIARMGGYLGRKNDGPPGWLSIWRGWKQLAFMVEGYTLAMRQQSYG